MTSPTQLCGDYFINNEIRFSIKQPGLNGKQEVFFLWFQRPSLKLTASLLLKIPMVGRWWITPWLAAKKSQWGFYGSYHMDFEHCSPKPTTTEALPGAWDALAVVVTASTVGSLGWTAEYSRPFWRVFGSKVLWGRWSTVFGQILATSRQVTLLFSNKKNGSFLFIRRFLGRKSTKNLEGFWPEMAKVKWRLDHLAAGWLSSPAREEFQHIFLGQPRRGWFHFYFYKSPVSQWLNWWFFVAVGGFKHFLFSSLLGEDSHFD